MRRVLFGGVFAALLFSGVALAQAPQPLQPLQIPTGAPAQVGFVEGNVTLEREGGATVLDAAMPIIPGDRLHTRQGRVEMLLGDGSTLAVDEHSTLDVLSSSLLRLLAGRVYLVVASDPNLGSATTYRIDTPVASVQTAGPGEHRVTFRTSAFGVRPEAELASVRGFAQLMSDLGVVALNPGELARVPEGGAPGYPQYFNSAHWDAFERWVHARRDSRRGALSAQYLPRELRPYAGTFDRYGTWGMDNDHGYVWYPTSIVAGWRPYSRGHWVDIPRLGWTWIGADAWSSPTHHYGRWGVTRTGTWFWIPRKGWAPAWVHWAIAPGYVSWCALGSDGRPVAPFSDFGVNPRVFDPSFAWTVIPHASFGERTPVTSVALDGWGMRGLGRVPFITQQTPPLPRHGAPARVFGPSSPVASMPQRPLANANTPQPPVAYAPPPAVVSPRGWARAGPPLNGVPAVPRPATGTEHPRGPSRDVPAPRTAQPTGSVQPVSPPFRHGMMMPNRPVVQPRVGAVAVPRVPAPSSATPPRVSGESPRSASPSAPVRSAPSGGWVGSRTPQPRSAAPAPPPASAAGSSKSQ